MTHRAFNPAITFQNHTTIARKPESGGSWWLGLDRQKFRQEQRLQQARMSGISKTQAIDRIEER